VVESSGRRSGRTTAPFRFAYRRTAVTPGIWAIACSIAAAAPSSRPSRLLSVAMSVDGLVLARYAGNDDCVRRAAATAVMAIPPTNPISTASPTYDAHRWRRLAVRRYAAIR